MSNLDDQPIADTLLGRVWETVGPKEFPTDDRSRMKMVVNNLVLHLHPAKVDARTLRMTYSWGLGGLSALLLMFLVITGIMLEANYTPSPSQAYLDILNLRSNVWFGELIRNIHHWSANLLIVVSVLHLLRVFFTGAHRPPRQMNWLIGVGMLLLVVGANFTGYLLPWDQLAYWAITVGTSILSYLPLVGEPLTQLLLGGPEVGAATLLNFYALHISIIPVSMVVLMSYHFWRVRKDGGMTTPKHVDGVEPEKVERLTTIPHLVRREMVWAVVWIALVLFWALSTPAPLEGIADPSISPNPAKAPWYFLGIQELLLHFHPLVGAILIPGMALSALALLPFYDIRQETVGVYFRSRRGRFFLLFSTGLALILTPAWIVLDEYVLDWVNWMPELPSLVSNGAIPLLVLGFVGFLIDRFVRVLLRADSEERVLFWFGFFLVAFVVLTLIGIFFRGEGMNLYWPWEIIVHG